ncbi:unnamed protein product [Didymodactylos carnosus]|uniref:Alpha/beta hydrolase fold-3 domain-containing protein n=1 Tax=Didymodactylos carnosus TaxID=1234261 RepID=A0A814B8V9_9BILA|nr:unnamed protein product [Didymodactylos carnosus]CAF3702687.1 unnamed protein product [Didymodactylos carnosus]
MLKASASETFGITTRINILRNCAKLAELKRTENVNVQIEDTKIDHVPVRIYRSNRIKDMNKSLYPVIVYYHGGAFYMGSLETHHYITSKLAELTDFIVISVDYRLAPEHPFPAGLDDCYKVTKYLFDHGKEFQIDQKRIVLAGDSAGGTFAAVLAQRLVDKDYSPKLQVLIYPIVQFFDFMLPSYMKANVEVLDYGTMADVLSIYLNKTITSDILGNNHTTPKVKKQFEKYIDWSLIPVDIRGERNPIAPDYGSNELYEQVKQALTEDISPLLVDDTRLKKLPPTYMLSVNHDRLRDENFIYAKRLENVGVKVVHHHYEHTFHGALNFLHAPMDLKIAHTMIDNIVRYLLENV